MTRFNAITVIEIDFPSLLQRIAKMFNSASQSPKSLELRAATSLARLLQRQNRSDEGLQILKRVHGWFTEGFDYGDLKEAEALIADLS